MTRFLPLALFLFALPALTPRISQGATARKPAEATYRKDQPEFCAAIRGNGELVMAHFNSLAHLVEHYGLFDGLAGGSSGAISSFIYESILQNPALRDCADCNSDAVVALRASFLLKSLWGYLEVLGTSSDATALAGFAKSVATVTAKLKRLSWSQLDTIPSEAEIKTAVKQFQAILASPDIKGLINPELVSRLESIASPSVKWYQLLEARAAVLTFGKFQAEDRHIFFRPALVSFEQLARDVGRVSNFYAGRGSFYDERKAKAVLDECAPGSLDLGWKEIAAKKPNCAASMVSLIRDYRTKLIDATGSGVSYHDIADSRLADPVGKYANILVTTMTLDPAASTTFREGLKSYQAGEKEFGAFGFKVFDGLKVGYWGQAEDLAKVMANPLGFDDLKTERIFSLGPASWETVLSRSPAEPGLSRLRDLPGGLVSAGGWSDLAPVLALKNVGCKKVVYITRRGEDSPFGRGIARNLGMTEAQDHALYDLDNPKSSLSRSIAQADAVWCTNWNAYPVATKLAGLDKDSYLSPLELPVSDGPPTVAPPAGFPAYSAVAPQTHRGCGGKQVE
jgi:hypothetical protein